MDGLGRYQEFVDGLVLRRKGVLSDWIMEGGWPQLEKNRRINEFLLRLSPSEREVLAEIASRARDGGIHDTLVYIQEQMDLGGLVLVGDGVELPVSPYDTGIFWDWMARASGEEWPKTP